MTLPIQPCVASRPRITRWGVFYGKRYTAFRKEAERVVPSIESPEGITFPLKGELYVKAYFHCKKPRTSKLAYPRGDVDNFLKTLDVCNTYIWEDDRQIIKLYGEKLWAKDCPRIELEISQL